MFLVQRFCVLYDCSAAALSCQRLSAFRAAAGLVLGVRPQTPTPRTWSARGFDHWTPQRICLSRRWLSHGRVPFGYRTRASPCLVGAGWAAFMPFVAWCRPRRPVFGPARRVMDSDGIRQQVATPQAPETAGAVLSNWVYVSICSGRKRSGACPPHASIGNPILSNPRPALYPCACRAPPATPLGAHRVHAERR